MDVRHRDSNVADQHQKQYTMFNTSGDRGCFENSVVSVDSCYTCSQAGIRVA
jgi:hypothetical protein